MFLNKKYINNIDSKIGVYIFKKNRRILYVGKSINIKARLLSHLENSKKDNKERLLINDSNYIKILPTDSEFNALLLESKLINKYKPKFNVRWKDNKSYIYIKIKKDKLYPKIFVCRKESDDNSIYFGPFPSIKTTEEILRYIRKIFPFCNQKKITKSKCFYSKIGLCNPCPNMIEHTKSLKIKKELVKEYNKNIYLIKKVLNGKNNVVEKYFISKINLLSKQKKFEDAILFRNKLFLFQKLMFQQINSNEYENIYNPKRVLILLTNELKKFYSNVKYLKRIECYDISNISFTSATGSMVVSINGSINKSEYKKFKINKFQFKSDIKMLEEVLIRRFKNDWPLPNLIIVDGGINQINIANKIIKKFKYSIPVIGIVKNPNRIIVGSYGLPKLNFNTNNPAFNLIINLRDESHRFAKKYHLFLRNYNFLNKNKN